MTKVYDAHKARLAQCAQKLVKPPFELLRAMYLEREREVAERRATLEQELHLIKQRAHQAALRIYLSRHEHSVMRNNDYVSTIHSLNAQPVEDKS